jgi:hypothetical protein
MIRQLESRSIQRHLLLAFSWTDESRVRSRYRMFVRGRPPSHLDFLKRDQGTLSWMFFTRTAQSTKMLVHASVTPRHPGVFTFPRVFDAVGANDGQPAGWRFESTLGSGKRATIAVGRPWAKQPARLAGI